MARGFLVSRRFVQSPQRIKMAPPAQFTGASAGLDDTMNQVRAYSWQFRLRTVSTSGLECHALCALETGEGVGLADELDHDAQRRTHEVAADGGSNRLEDDALLGVKLIRELL